MCFLGATTIYIVSDDVKLITVFKTPKILHIYLEIKQIARFSMPPHIKGYTQFPVTAHSTCHFYLTSALLLISNIEYYGTHCSTWMTSFIGYNKY